MNARSPIRGHILGLVLGLAGAALNLAYMRYFEQQASGGAKVALLVTAKPVVRGQPITADMLGAREVPQAYVDERALRATDKDRIVGLRATNNIPVAQIVQFTDTIAPSDQQRDLSVLVQPGNRALPLKVEQNDVLALIRPGDFVDIVGVLNGESMSLLQRVLVLATGLDLSADTSAESRREQRATTITVSVGIGEGQLLALAMERGKLSVLVRNPEDHRIAETQPNVSDAALFDTARRAQLQRHRRPGRAAPSGPVRLEEAK